MKKFFKKRYMKTWLYYHPEVFYEEFDEDGTRTVMIDLYAVFEIDNLPTHEVLDSMIDIYYKIKKI
jgi:hypothetical protein